MTGVQKRDTPNGLQNQGPLSQKHPREVRIVAHTMLFYWWPVWAVGLLLAGPDLVGRQLPRHRAGRYTGRGRLRRRQGSPGAARRRPSAQGP